MKTKAKLFLLALPVLGGLIARWRGGWGLNVAKVAKSFIWSLPYACLTAACLSPWTHLWPYASVVVLGTTMAADLTGHGQWFSLAYIVKRIRPERLDFIVAWVFGPDFRTELPEGHGTVLLHRPASQHLYWRCVFGLGLKGVLGAAGAAIALAFTSVPLALIVLAGGALLPLGYMIGWHLFTENVFEDGTEGKATATGEVIGGLLRYGSLLFVFWWVL